FLAAGLFGLLFGHGLFGGMGGFASLLGLMLQIGLIVIVARLLFVWWQRRSQPAYATAHPATDHSFSGLGGMFGANAPAGEALTIAKTDYDAFERLLQEVQADFSEEDLNALRTKVTPEMLSYFSEQLAENASRGLVNKVTDVKLEQGDLAEAWREGGVDYATVAMRFALTDRMVERASGRTVEDGGPGEVTELWTFMRASGGGWLVSAIQQAERTAITRRLRPALLHLMRRCRGALAWLRVCDRQATSRISHPARAACAISPGSGSAPCRRPPVTTENCRELRPSRGC